MKKGYARVSTTDQNLDSQVMVLKQKGCEKVYTDKMSGKEDERSGLMELVESIQEGDEVYVWDVKRLSRNGIISSLKIAGEIKDKD